MTPELRNTILAYRRQGMNLAEIAAHLGVCEKDAKPQVEEVMDWLVEQYDAPIRSDVALELSRIDAMLQAIFDNQARQGDLKAIDTVCKLMERRAKLRGLDAPTKSASINLLADKSDEEIWAELRRLNVELIQPKQLEVVDDSSPQEGSV